MDYAGKNITVIGAARTGLAVAEVMTDLGANVHIFDNKPAEELTDAIATADSLGVRVTASADKIDLNGVDLIVPSPGVPADLSALQEANKRGIEIISEIELAYRISKAPIVAITGTNGKTTTTVMTERMLEAAGYDTYIAGNIAANDIEMPLVRAAYQAAAKSVIVAELSSFQLELIKDFRPKVAMLLNISKDHMDRHVTMDNYIAAKTRIFENQTADDFAVINADNPITAALATSLKANVLQFSIKSEVEEGAFLQGDKLVLRFQGNQTTICQASDIPLPGAHNIENTLAAICAAAVFAGPDFDKVRDAIRAFEPVPHRMEPVASINDVLYINNSMCTNVVAVVRSIEATERPQIIISGGKLKGKADDFSPIGDAYKRKAKHVILIGADAQTLRQAAQNAGFDAITMASSMPDAVQIASRLAEPGDVVVLSPGMASFDMFRDFQHRGKEFEQAVRELEREQT
ncbi:MAG: UDP-N-acetylmuramoyl-L-alanine--D-glutamate ligase [Armatimonadota bacterium]